MMDTITLQSFLSFDKMIAPTVIKVVYWIGLVFLALGALVALIGGFAMMGHNFGMGLGRLILSLAGFAVGTLFWRIIMEVYIVFFSIHERLTEIRDELEVRPHNKSTD